MIKKRTTQLLTPIQLDTGWYLRNYLILADANEPIVIDSYNARLKNLVTKIENSHLSSEFEYFKVGFIVGHFGKRGICISIWHWGKWLASHEMFNQCWYTYGRDLDKLALLDGDEPVFCQFEVPIISEELGFFQKVASDGYDVHSRDLFVGFQPPL